MPDARTESEGDARPSEDTDTQPDSDEASDESDSFAAGASPAGNFAFPPLPEPEEEAPDTDEETPDTDEEVVPSDPCTPDYQNVASCFGTEAPAFAAYDFQPQSCGFGATYGLDAFKGRVTFVALFASW